MIRLPASPTSAPPTIKTSRCSPQILLPRPSSAFQPRSLRASHGRTGRVQCSSRTPGPRSDENDNKAVLDAFFLGKAFAEALNELIGSTVGEILSVVGQWQAEQQKQVQDFQEEVVERAKRAKEKAALEAMEAQGIVSKALTAPADATAPAVSPPSPSPTSEDPLQEMLKD